MRIAGVHLPDGRRVWADAGELDIEPRDVVIIEIAGANVPGIVFVAPDQVLSGPPGADTQILRVSRPSAQDVGCEDLPGSDMPHLGLIVTGERSPAHITAIDHVRRTIVLTHHDGESVEQPVPSEAKSQ